MSGREVTERGTMDLAEELRLHPDRWVVERTPDGYAAHRRERDLREVHVEVTTRCNLECGHCVRNVWESPWEDMDPATFDALVGGLRELPRVDRVHFGGFGEPLVHPDIVAMVQRIHSLGIRTSMITNGTLLTEGMADSLLDAGLDRLFVSVDSPRRASFADARDGADLDLVLDNLRTLRDLRASRGSPSPTIEMEAVVTRDNLEELEEMPSLAKEMGVSVVLLTHLLPHEEGAADGIAYGEGAPELPRSAGWGVLAGDQIMWGTLSAPRSGWGAERWCPFVNNKRTMVGRDGGVSPCPALMRSYRYFIFGDEKRVKRYLLGNVNHRPLADTWTSEEYVLFRSKVTDFRFPSCVDCGANCDLRQGNADCYANEVSCADCLWAQDILRCP